MSINALFHSASPADVPRQPVASEPGQDSPKPARAPELTIGFASARAIRAGTKTTAIVPLSRYPGLARLETGDVLTFDVQARARRHRRRLEVSITSVCPHDFLGDVPACGGEHQAAAINPENPTWAHCLGFAANSGSTPLPARDRNRLAARGWVVIDFKTVA